MKTIEKIIPYERHAIEWHLSANCGYDHYGIKGICDLIDQVNEGSKELSDEIAPNTGVSIAEMLDDLKIDYIS